MENILIIVLVALILLYAVYIISQSKKCNPIKSESGCQTDKMIIETMVRNSNAYIILINKNFHVIKSNFHISTSGIKSSDVKLLGEIVNTNIDVNDPTSDKMLCKNSKIRQSIESSYNNMCDFNGVKEEVVIHLSDNKVNKKRCIVEISGTHVNINDENMLLITMYDITDIIKSFEELRKQKTRNEELYRKKAAFLSNMGHDIRTPINSIIGFTDLISSAESDEERLEFTKIVSSNSYVLLQMVNDIIDLAKIEANLMKLSYTEIDARSILKELENNPITTSKNDNVDIVYVRNGETVSFLGDKNRVMQVLINFVMYAIKHTESGTINYGYRIQRDSIYFYVNGTADLISNNNTSAIFNGFSEFCKNTNSNPNISLSICQTLTTMMGGEIGADSDSDEGTTLWFVLPLK